jgi:hypothetical protein
MSDVHATELCAQNGQDNAEYVGLSEFADEVVELAVSPPVSPSENSRDDPGSQPDQLSDSSVTRQSCSVAKFPTRKRLLKGMECLCADNLLNSSAENIHFRGLESRFLFASRKFIDDTARCLSRLDLIGVAKCQSEPPLSYTHSGR